VRTILLEEDPNRFVMELLQKRGGGDFLKELAEAVLDLMQLDVEGLRHDGEIIESVYLFVVPGDSVALANLIS
jgi:hypothetical protein